MELRKYNEILMEIEEINPDAIKLDGLDECIVGICETFEGTRLLYSENRIIESLSDNKIGLKPLLGVGKPYGTSLTSKAGSITPAASTIGTVTQILYDWGRGRHTHHTARRIRKLVPLNNIWYLDGIFDKFEKGIY